MPKRQPNYRKVLAGLLEYIASRLIVVEDCQFVLSCELLLKHPVIVQALEELGCIQRLGRLSHNLPSPDGHSFVCEWQEMIVLKSRMRMTGKMKSPWGRVVWMVNTTRFDQVLPQLLENALLLEKIERAFKRGMAIRQVGEDDQPISRLPWRIVQEDD
ncbi:MAG: hypothetical protein ABH810_03515 [bacterium]